jgi:hypothetical protein
MQSPIKSVSPSGKDDIDLPMFNFILATPTPSPRITPERVIFIKPMENNNFIEAKPIDSAEGIFTLRAEDDNQPAQPGPL